MVRRGLSLLAVLLLAGCSDADNSSATTATPDGTETAVSKSATQSATADPAVQTLEELPVDIPAEQQRATTEGLWFLLVNVGDGETYVALMNIKHGAGEVASASEPESDPDSESADEPDGDASPGDGLAVELLETTPEFAKWSLSEHEVDDDDVHLVFGVEGLDGVKIDFRGRLHEGVIYGNLQTNPNKKEPARLFPTEETTTATHEKAIPASGRSALRAALSDTDPFSGALKFCREHAKSPLALQVYDRLLSNAIGKLEDHLDASQVEQTADEYLAVVSMWGDRMAELARYNLGLRLSVGMAFPELGLKYLDAAEAAATEDVKNRYQETADFARSRAQLAIARNRVAEARENTDADPQTADRTISEVVEAYPFDPTITFAAAKHALDKNRVGDALELYGRLAATPYMEPQLMQGPDWQGDAESPPSETVALLWKSRHRSTDGLEEFLATTYQASIDRMLDMSAQQGPASPDGERATRTVLCELFTGAQCPPCVAADVASVALDRAYGGDVILLRHHQHIPGPDPLTNEDSDKRFGYYVPDGSKRATPTMVVNGLRSLVGFGGMFDDTPRVYRSFRAQIDPRMDDESGVAIELTASLEDGILAIDAKASGFEEAADDLRLVLFLVEHEVALEAANGIRQHEMLVRSMLSAPEGIPATEGRLEFTDRIEFQDFKLGLADYLTTFQAKNPGVTFAEAPLELKSLHLAACVQNHQTREILQAAIAPVTMGEDATTSDERPPVSAPRSQVEAE